MHCPTPPQRAAETGAEPITPLSTLAPYTGTEHDISMVLNTPLAGSVWLVWLWKLTIF